MGREARAEARGGRQAEGRKGARLPKIRQEDIAAINPVKIWKICKAPNPTFWEPSKLKR